MRGRLEPGRQWSEANRRRARREPQSRPGQRRSGALDDGAALRTKRVGAGARGRVWNALFHGRGPHGARPVACVLSRALGERRARAAAAEHGDLRRRTPRALSRGMRRPDRRARGERRALNRRRHPPAGALTVAVQGPRRTNCGRRAGRDGAREVAVGCAILSGMGASKLTLDDTEVPRIGLGTNRLTSTSEHVALVQEAVTAGLGLIDTAHTYAGGESEKTIGAA